MTSLLDRNEDSDLLAVEPIFVNDRVLQVLRIQVAILNARSSRHAVDELEPLFAEVEQLLRDLVREVGAA